MAITLDHTIVPSHDQDAAARFTGELFGVPWGMRNGHFSPVYLNDTLTFDFGNADTFESHHYCVQVGDAEFDEIFGRLRAAGLAYGSLPWAPDDMKVNTQLGGKNIYWRDPDGHLWEMLTISYSRMQAPALPESAH